MSADLAISDFLFPLVKHQRQGLVELGCGPPSGRALHFSGVANHPSLLRLAETFRVLLYSYLHARNCRETNQQHPDTLLASGTDVVYLAIFAAPQERKICPHHIAHIGEVTGDVDIADRDRRLTPAQFDLDYLSRKIRHDESFALSRTNVIEGAGDGYVHAFRDTPLVAERLSRQLAHCIRV